MYEKKTWKNRQSEYPNRRTLTPVDGQENTFDVARAEGLVMEEGDAFDQDAMNDLENRIGNGFVDCGVNLYTHTKTGTVHEFTGQGANGRAIMTADVAAGDTITVNGTPVTAYMGAESAVDMMAGSPYTGRWVTFVYDSEAGTLNFKGGGGKVTVSGLSAGVVKKGTTVTVKQGAKTIQSVAGSYAPQLQHYYFTTSGYTTHSREIPNTNGKSGTMTVVIGEFNQGNDPYSSMKLSRQTSKTGIANSGIEGKSRYMANKFTFSAGSGNVVLSFASGIQGGTTHVLCTYTTD